MKKIFCTFYFLLAASSIVANEAGNLLNNKSGTNTTNPSCGFIAGYFLPIFSASTIYSFYKAHVAYGEYQKFKLRQNTIHLFPNNNQVNNHIRTLGVALNHIAADIEGNVATFIPDTQDRIKSNRNQTIAWSLVGASSLTLSALTGYLTYQSLLQ